MTTPAPAPAAAPAAPAPDLTGALWRAFCVLAASIDTRLTDPAADPGAVVNVALTRGADPADIKIIHRWAAAR